MISFYLDIYNEIYMISFYFGRTSSSTNLKRNYEIIFNIYNFVSHFTMFLLIPNHFVYSCLSVLVLVILYWVEIVIIK